MRLDNSRVLVIGGAGFVGSHVVEELLKEPVCEVVVLDNFVRGTRANLHHARKDNRLRVVDGSITDVSTLHSAMQGVDFVFHLAALWLYECVHQPRAAIDVNVVGTYNVIEAVQEAGVRKTVYSSSASVYGDATSTPMDEQHCFNNRTMYGATKIAGEQFFRAFNEQHRTNYVGLRYMNIYGPRMDYKGAYVSVIMKVLDRIEQGLSPVIFGDGSQSYDFVHVHDVARANILALKSDATDSFFNISTGIGTSINELVHLLLEITGSGLQPEYRAEEQMFVTNRIGSTQKAERELGFLAQLPLCEGLRSVVQWRSQDQQSLANQGPSN